MLGSAIPEQRRKAEYVEGIAIWWVMAVTHGSPARRAGAQSLAAD